MLMNLHRRRRFLFSSYLDPTVLAVLRDAAEQRRLSRNAPYLTSPGLQVARRRPDLELSLEHLVFPLEHADTARPLPPRSAHTSQLLSTEFHVGNEQRRMFSSPKVHTHTHTHTVHG